MLNQETKRRIDAARDILVGKVPDPKTQVEQITTALIYKFMDDIDKESLDLGGDALFFVGDYAKYSWDKLLDSRLSGIARLDLYVEALNRMPLNPQLPQLFRNILKGAVLPYKDPEILKLFLKEIDGFTYDHSEKLGDAFEYLLQVSGSQGDVGQFRTPRHIIDFIVAVVDPQKNETIMDPACGTAGFLISSYKHILMQNTKEYPGDLLTPDEKAKLMSNIVGYDISPDMVRLSLVNMYLHGFQSPNAYEYDTLTNEERWDDTFDVIMANPPFMSPKGGIRPHSHFSIPSNRSEVLFVNYIVEHLNNHGRAGIIVPEGIIFQSGSAYKSLRRMLVEHYIWAVVSLPAGVFQPYSGVKTSILLIDKQLAKKSESIIFVKVENDGFDLGAQRRSIEKNDLPRALSILKKYKHFLENGISASTFKYKETDIANIAEKSQIVKNGDYNLSWERYKENNSVLITRWPIVRISELADRITKGTTPTTNGFRFENDGINFVKIESIAENGTIIANKLAFVSRECHESFKRSQLKKNDVLFSIAGAFGRVAVVDDRLLPANTNQALAIISPKQHLIDPKYLYYILKSQIILNEVRRQIVGVAQYNLSLTQVGNLSIPLPPLEIQKEIVAELEEYQKIIDGAKQIVDSYKPIIWIDPKWNSVELGSVCKTVQYGLSKEMNTESVGYKIFRMGEIQNGRVVDTGKMKYADVSESEFEKYRLRRNDILFNRTNSYELVGKTGIFDLEGDYCFASYLVRLVIDENKALPAFINYLLNTDAFQTKIKSFATRGVSQANVNAKNLQTIMVPLPPLDMQKQIVAQLEKEQQLVAANSQLIEIFEHKIKEKIAEVWRTEETEPSFVEDIVEENAADIKENIREVAATASEIDVVSKEEDTSETDDDAVEVIELTQGALFPLS